MVEDNFEDFPYGERNGEGVEGPETPKKIDLIDPKKIEDLKQLKITNNSSEEEILDAMDEIECSCILKELGLSPDASGKEITKASINAYNTRLAIELGLSPDASEEEIRKVAAESLDMKKSVGDWSAIKVLRSFEPNFLEYATLNELGITFDELSKLYLKIKTGLSLNDDFKKAIDVTIEKRATDLGLSPDSSLFEVADLEEEREREILALELGVSPSWEEIDDAQDKLKLGLSSKTTKEDIKKAKAVKLGLSPNASWLEIYLAQEGKKALNLGLDVGASWLEINKAQQRKVVLWQRDEIKNQVFDM